MTQSKRPSVIAGNWKMYKTIDESLEFVKEFIPLVAESPATVFLSVPYTSIHAAAEAAKGSNVVIGAQNMNDATEGAFTGEIAGRMLVDAGAKFVILGHSERRHVFNETDEFINKKVKRALSDGIVPIVCIGETLEERDAGKTHDILKSQITHSLDAVTHDELPNILIAYEPVWAIGTGKTATPELAQEVHAFCREYITKLWGEESAEKVVIMYGGSVKPDNARQLMDKKDIDGLLVGGASLSPESFSQIVNYQNALTH
ncbi:MAG: triose-phosphate isomerase [Chlamydiota bacterium]|nr:triose-phosphate isomerase [Chlamydiota bacterium]